jgi:hypothetical protein
MSHLSYRQALAAHFAHFHGSNDAPSPEEREALAWIKAGEAWLKSVPAAVCLAQPVHADNVEAMNEALSDLRGDVVGHFRKEQGL